MDTLNPQNIAYLKLWIHFIYQKCMKAWKAQQPLSNSVNFSQIFWSFLAYNLLKWLSKRSRAHWLTEFAYSGALFWLKDFTKRHSNVLTLTDTKRRALVSLIHQSQLEGYFHHPKGSMFDRCFVYSSGLML